MKPMLLNRSKLLILILIFTFGAIANAQIDLDYYLPEIEYNKSVPTPKDILGFQVGDWHVTHGQLLLYMHSICDESPNCFITEYARSHEGKPLIYLTISSEENIKNIENIRQEHIKLSDAAKGFKVDVQNMPIVIYQGYSIHGNESSGANAAMLNAYYLLAGQSKKRDNLLSNSVILLDPVYNPDGFQRFSTWANSHKHQHLVSDTNGREFNEVWPGGRTNHYWFDLNRDWLFNIHPSSKGRIETFHKWKPDILTDHHEMGSNSTFFFQPGIPSRTNPNTPQINQDITEEIGHFHASFLDSIGSLYYTKESFDDFYYGKGSTYPDINGCIGILFEQASTRGHLRETTNGIMSFPFTIRNQLVTSLSTQDAGIALREKILNYKQDFYTSRYNDKDLKGYYIFESDDSYKVQFLLNMLNRHQINVYRADKNYKISNQIFTSSKSYIVPKKQNQAPLIKTIFETVNTFRDSLFYDVSAWTIPLALNIKYGEFTQSFNHSKLTAAKAVTTNFDTISSNKKSYALALDWANTLAPNTLYKLLAKEFNIKVLTKPTSLKSDGSWHLFNQGTIIIPLSNQPISRDSTIAFINTLIIDNQQTVKAIDTGLSKDGQSLGSPSQNNLMLPKVAMIVGEGINAYEAGDTWYQFDFRLDMPLTMIDKRQFERCDLNKYNVLILPDGSYEDTPLFTSKIINWVNQGGNVIAFRRALNYTKKIGLTSSLNNTYISTKPRATKYKEISSTRGSHVIGGAIFETEIDLDHPLFFGYKSNKLPVFKRGTQFYDVTNTLASPMVYSSAPLLSGYASNFNIEKAKGSAAIICFGYGNGRIIGVVDNPNFRGYWLGGSQLFANAIFFPNLIASGSLVK